MGRKHRPEGSTYVCSTWGYVMEKHAGKWVRQHRLRMERKLNRKLKPWEIVHHKDENRTNNRLSNLELTTDFKHKSHHSSKRRWSEEVKHKMRVSAVRIAANPAEREQRSMRAKRQHRQGNFGRSTWRNK